jgi:uncharacterized membrane protein YkoI
MNNKVVTLGFALAMGTLSMGVSGVALAQKALTAPQVQAKLTEQGYTKVHDVEFKEGMWRADAKSANGKHVNVRIDAKTGQVYPDEQVSKLSEQDVRAALETQGYTDVHDVDFDNGVWKAKAHNQSGKRVKLKVDSSTGKVIATD